MQIHMPNDLILCGRESYSIDTEKFFILAVNFAQIDGDRMFSEVGLDSLKEVIEGNGNKFNLKKVSKDLLNHCNISNLDTDENFNSITDIKEDIVNNKVIIEFNKKIRKYFPNEWSGKYFWGN